MQSAYGGQKDWTVTTFNYAFIDDYVDKNCPNNCLAIHQDVSQASITEHDPYVIAQWHKT
jgi:hypothetical protein